MGVGELEAEVKGLVWRKGINSVLNLCLEKIACPMTEEIHSNCQAVGVGVLHKGHSLLPPILSEL